MTATAARLTLLATVLLLATAAPATADPLPPPGALGHAGAPGALGADGAVGADGEWPLRPTPAVVAPFDPPAVAWESGHRGVDLAGRPGQPVRAALPGRVSFAGRVAGVAVVVVDHGATRTTYQPVEGAVAVGTRVAAGEVVGTLGWFGTHCLPRACLHWGWVQGSTYLDPLLLVDGPRPVRLLPTHAAPAAREPAAPARAAGHALVFLGVATGVSGSW